MPTTRKKVIKTIYKDDDDSEDLGGDFSDSGSEAKISSAPSSEDSYNEENYPSSDNESSKNPEKIPNIVRKKKPQFAKAFISKINKQDIAENEEDALPVSTFSVRDLTEADKLLPSVLNLSESDSSDDECTKPTMKKKCNVEMLPKTEDLDIDDNDAETEYKDVWSKNEKDDESEEIAKKTFLELEQHKAKIEEAKLSILKYSSHNYDEHEFDVKDLLAQGEVIEPELGPIKKKKNKKALDQSDSEVEDWEEVNESKSIPQQGLQLIVDIPDSVSRKTKKVDVEMMMKRKMNRVKKEYQVYMHKVHVLCWLGHGNYISTVLNDQEVMSTALSLMPSKECYPSERVDMKYVEQITSWYKNKLSFKKDRNEGKFRPKAPKLKEILIKQIKNRILTSKKYLVYVFVAMLRAIGLQCRVMLNFQTVPIKPPASELHSLSTKNTEGKKGDRKDVSKDKKITNRNSKKINSNKKIPQLDGNYDWSSDSDSDFTNIMQVDGNDDNSTRKTRTTRSATSKGNRKNNKEENNDLLTSKTRSSRRATSKEKTNNIKESEEGVSPPKRAKQSEDNVHEQADGKNKLSLRRQRNQIGRKTPKSGNNLHDNVPLKLPEIEVTNEENKKITESNFFVGDENPKLRLTRKRSATTNSRISNNTTTNEIPRKATQAKTRAKSTPVRSANASNSNEDLSASATKKPRKTVKDFKENENNKVLLKLKETVNKNSDDDVLAEEDTKTHKSDSEDDFKTVKLSSPKPSTRTVRKTKTTPKTEVISKEIQEKKAIKFFANENSPTNSNKSRLSRKRSTINTRAANEIIKTEIPEKITQAKARARSTPTRTVSKYFTDVSPSETKKLNNTKAKNVLEDKQRVSHKELLKQKIKPTNDVTSDLVNIIKSRVKEAKSQSKKMVVKGSTNKDSDEDSNYLPEEDIKPRERSSDDDFKPVKISPKAGASHRIDRRVLSLDEEVAPDKIDVWCEVFVEELEEWVAVDVIRSKVHCVNEIYSKASHPVVYVVGWDNNNYLKDLTRRYVPQWNTITRKQRAEVSWWNTAVAPWLGPKNARDNEEDERLDRMQLEAPLPKSISEYKNHPLYALKRHLLKFEAIYPPDAATLGFVRGEPVYARECVYVCRSRDIWLKEAKVVKLGEKPYKVVKARPKWDRLSNKIIKDKPLEIFGPWQVNDYEPPVAENGIVPRNAYGNVELFKECMLPKGTVHIKLPGLNRVAKKLNIDCAPAMTGFDFNGGWSHPVYDGFVVCKEYEEVITEAWVKDQEEQERKEREKIDARVYGNWRRLIKGLFIRERLKVKYGFDGPSTSEDKKKPKGPRLVVKRGRNK